MTHTQLSECSVRAPIWKGREGNWKGGEVLGTTSIDLTVGVESTPEAEAWMLEDLDLSPGCEYRVHPGCRAAEWIVWCKPICEHAHPPRFFCDPCLELRRGPSRITCLICGTVADSLGNITRIERI